MSEICRPTKRGRGNTGRCNLRKKCEEGEGKGEEIPKTQREKEIPVKRTFKLEIKNICKEGKI
jgi:hypothetical protein